MCVGQLYWIIVDRTGVEIPLDVMLSSLGYGAALLCSSAGGGWKCAEAAGVVDLRGCSRESCVVYPRSTQVKLCSLYCNLYFCTLFLLL